MVLKRSIKQVRWGGREVEKVIQEQASTLFVGKRGPKKVSEHNDPERLYSEIGRLKKNWAGLTKVRTESANNSERPYQSLYYKTPDAVYQSRCSGGAMIIDRFGDTEVGSTVKKSGLDQ